jgi:AcrR family transcriptional regulator
VKRGEVASADASPTWRDLAVARSLDSARARAKTRVERFIAAARDLATERGSSTDFTVQDVVERSGQSLRSFYQYFTGKHELLLALFEETVRATATELQQRIDREDDPLERLHRFVVEYHRLCRPTRKGRGSRSSPVALAEFVQQLMTSHPEEATHAYAPIVELFEGLLDEAADAGVIRTELNRRRVTGVVLESIMFNEFSNTIAGAARWSDEEGDPAEDLWTLMVHGITG